MSTRKRVLVIEGDNEASGLIADTLRRRGVEVFPFSDPDEGVSRAAEISPDLAFISILFSGSNGLKISRAVHSLEGLQKVPVIMLISYPDELDPKYTSTIGIVDVVVKPVTAEEILSKTVAVLGEGTIAEESNEEPPEETPVAEEAEAASLDEEWMTFLDAEEREKAETLSSSEPPPYEETVEEAPETAEAAPPGAGEDTEDFLLAEERREPEPVHGEELRELFDVPRRRPMKKFIVIAAAVLVIVAAAAVGAYFFFQRQGSVTTHTTVKVPLKKAPAATAARNAAPAEKTVVPSQAPAPAKAAVPAAASVSRKGGEPIVKEAPKAEKQTYSVQLGAFRNGNNAAALVEKLKKKGYDAFVRDEPGRPVHRVLIGKFGSRTEAAAEAKRVLETEGLKSIIFRY